MTLKCESCGTENPSNNRFCGQCGRQLGRIHTDTPEEFWRDISISKPLPPEVAADLPPEIIDFDNGIPLIASNNADRRLHAPPEIVERAHDSFERESELHNRVEHGGETHFEAQAKEQVSGVPGEYTDAAVRREAGEANYRGDAIHTGHDVDESVDDKAAHYAAAEASNSRASMDLNFIPDSERTQHTGVSGPSFLGLTDDHPTEYDYEDHEPESHIRRNIGLAVASVVVVLVGLQWRSIRDYGMSYVQNGSIAVRQNKQQTAPPVAGSDNGGRDLTQSAASKPADSEIPKPVETSPNANRALPVQQQTQAAARPPESHASPSPRAAMPPSMSTPTPDAPESNTRVTPTRRITSHPQPLHSRTSATHRASPNPATPRKTGAGSEEMKRAASASDNEARAAWLWKAVGKGNSQAPVELAKMYEKGTGVVRSCDQAQVLLRSAAARGNEQAKVSLQQIRLHGCTGR